MLEFLAVVTIGAYYLSRSFETRRLLDRLKYDKTDLDAANNRSSLLFDPQKYYAKNVAMGNPKWDGKTVKPPATTTWFKKPTPKGSDVADFSHEGNQWLRTPEFRKLYVENYRNAMSAERDFAVRNQLVSGYQKENITKGRVLQHISRADGRYNPDGINLHHWQTNV